VHELPNAPKRGPLWIWIGTVCTDLVLQAFSPYELLKSFLRDRLVHRLQIIADELSGNLELKATTWLAISFISSESLSYAFLRLHSTELHN
jgi:hypothetical protein